MADLQTSMESYLEVADRALAPENDPQAMRDLMTALLAMSAQLSAIEKTLKTLMLID